MKRFLLLVLSAFLFLSLVSSAYAKPRNRLSKIREGCKVTIEYVVVAGDTLVESSETGGPLVFTVGKGEVIPGLEREAIGMRMGDFKKFIVEPKDGYGEATEPVRELPLSALPPDVKPLPRMVLMLDDETTGRKRFITIVKVKEKSVVVDFNHPLAGKELYFEIKILDFDDPVSVQ